MMTTSISRRTAGLPISSFHSFTWLSATMICIHSWNSRCYCFVYRFVTILVKVYSNIIDGLKRICVCECVMSYVWNIVDLGCNKRMKDRMQTRSCSMLLSCLCTRKLNKQGGYFVT